jgi:hypothetical protein
MDNPAAGSNARQSPAYMKETGFALVPPAVVTTIRCEVVSDDAGVSQVAEVAEITFRLVQADPPTVMPVAPVKLVPVTVITVPPAAGP